MKTKFGLKAEVVSKVRDVLLKYSPEKIIIYGSRAKGNYRTGSDIDLTIVSPQLSLTDLLKIENELDDLMLPYKFDVSLFHQIDNASLIEHIERVGVEFK